MRDNDRPPDRHGPSRRSTRADGDARKRAHRRGIRNLQGDYRGGSNRQVTILAREAWEAACAELGHELPWTTRRSNLFVEQVALPRRSGAVIAIGEVRVEVTGEVDPCSRMKEAAPGLRQALKPEWRGGVGCRVLEGGGIALGDSVWIEETQ